MKIDTQVTLYRQMMETARVAGIGVIGKRKGAKLLALCYLYGDEPFVFNEKLHTDSITAAKLYGVHAMGNPDGYFSQYIRDRVRELKEGTAGWIESIDREYGTEFARMQEDLHSVGMKQEDFKTWLSTHI